VEASSRGRPIVPGFWADFYKETHIPAAILAHGRLHVTGHTGTLDDGTFPDGDEAQIRQTFRNLSRTLTEAGATWDDVVELTTYHVNLSAQAEPLLRVAAEFLRDPYPAWTATGITELFEAEALVEISCLAVLADSVA
jgi:enamine deaminase RidA (YjgF/YER057c/UK114 family)